MNPGGKYRTDASAWSVVALSAVSEGPNLLMPARASLAINQLETGAVPFSKNNQEAIWTTPVAILAWEGSNEFSFMKNKAVDFLLKTEGVHWKKKPDAPFDHDTALRGWAWTSRTHSWVEPTALSLIALRVAGYEAHERVREGLRMMMDRQLSEGGWNYGNTKVFGKELYPMPETTGIALSSIAGVSPRASVDKSLNYLRSSVEKSRTPITLGWGLLGLSAYGERPDSAEQLITECFSQQKKYGAYDTAMLSLLILAFIAKDGVVKAFKGSGSLGSSLPV